MTNGVPYTFAYQYMPNDELAQISYPSGRTINYLFSAGGRVQSVNGVLTATGTTTNYTDPAQKISWAAHGALASLPFYNGVLESWNFNPDGRGQPADRCEYL